MYNYFHLALLELTILLSYIMILLSNTVAMYNTRSRVYVKNNSYFFKKMHLKSSFLWANERNWITFGRWTNPVALHKQLKRTDSNNQDEQLPVT